MGHIVEGMKCVEPSLSFLQAAQEECVVVPVHTEKHCEEHTGLAQ